MEYLENEVLSIEFNDTSFTITYDNNEIEIVQKAMNFRYPAKIEFDRMDLSNEDAEKALLIQLADRNLISDELLQTRFGFDPDMEKSRLNRENKDRKSEKMINKAGPWYDPQFENALKKLSLQLGLVTPSQVGLDLPKKKPGEKTALEQKAEQIKAPFGSPKTVNDSSSESLPKEAGEGRPKLSKDVEKRKDKTFTPQTGAKLAIWSSSAQDYISQLINPLILDYFNKKNLRSLSNKETDILEEIKTNILFNTKPYAKLNSDYINNSLNLSINNTTKSFYNWLNLLKNEINRDLTVEEIKHAKASFYVMVYNQD